MCFYARSDSSRARRTEGSITGFKRFKKRGKSLSSPYIGTKWKLGERKKIEDFEKTASNGEVNVGLHCYKTFEEANRARCSGEKIYIVTIPDGAFVHENSREYCASEMILTPIDVKVIPVSKR